MERETKTEWAIWYRVWSTARIAWSQYGRPVDSLEDAVRKIDGLRKEYGSTNEFRLMEHDVITERTNWIQVDEPVVLP